MQQIAKDQWRDNLAVTGMILGLACLFLLGGSLFVNQSFAGSGAVEKDKDLFVYIFGDQGEFTKLDLRDMQVTAKWNLAQVEGLASDVPSYSPVTAAHAAKPWHAGNILYDARTQRVFGVFPGEISDDGLLAKYSILVFRIPDFQLLGTIPFTEKMNAAPSIVMSVDGRTLFVSYATNQQSQMIGSLDIYSTGDLKKANSLRESLETAKYVTGARLNNHFGEEAYVLSDGKHILDWNYMLWKLSLIGDHVTRESVGAHYAGPVVAGKILMIEKDAAASERFVSVVDLEANQTVGVKIHVPPVGNLYLSPDSAKVVLAAFRIENGVGYLTGQFTVYSVADGAQIRTLNFSPLAGKTDTHRMLCVSPDGEHMIFQAGKAQLFDVQLAGSFEARPIPARMNIGDSPRCVFTTESARSTN